MEIIKKYGTQLNSQDIWKFLAIVLMVVDHIGKFYYPDQLWFRVMGRMCIPIWFFFVGYSKSQPVNAPIIVGALLLVLVDVLIKAPIFPLNILVTIICYRLIHHYFLNKYLDKSEYYELIMAVVLILIFYLPTMWVMEYGTLALVFTALGRLIRMEQQSARINFYIVLAVLAFALPETYAFGFTPVQTAILLIGIALVTFMLSHYQLVKYNITYHTPAAIIMFLARNSLYFYVIHIIILLCIDRMINPEDYDQFSWM